MGPGPSHVPIKMLVKFRVHGPPGPVQVEAVEDFFGCGFYMSGCPIQKPVDAFHRHILIAYRAQKTSGDVLSQTLILLLLNFDGSAAAWGDGWLVLCSLSEAIDGLSSCLSDR